MAIWNLAIPETLHMLRMYDDPGGVAGRQPEIIVYFLNESLAKTWLRIKNWPGKWIIEEHDRSEILYHCSEAARQGVTRAGLVTRYNGEFEMRQLSLALFSLKVRVATY